MPLYIVVSFFSGRYLPGRYLLAKNLADTNKTARDEAQEPLVNDIEPRLEVAVYPERNAMERVNNHRNPRAPSSQPAKQSRLDRMGVDDVIAPGSEQPIQLNKGAAIFDWMHRANQVRHHVNRNAGRPRLLNQRSARSADQLSVIAILDQSPHRKKGVALGTAVGSGLGDDMEYPILSFVHGISADRRRSTRSREF